MTDAARITIILLAVILGFGIAFAAETTPVYPGTGGAPVEVLTNMYPTVRDNPVIIGYVVECGVGTWHEEQMGADFKSVHLIPANSCGKQLVFSARKSAGRDDAMRIADVWIIGANETWSSSMDTVYSGDGSFRNHDLTTRTGRALGFVVPEVLMAIILGAILAAVIRRDL